MVFYCPFDLILFYRLAVIKVYSCFACTCGHRIPDEVNKLDHFTVTARDITIKNCERLTTNLDDKVRE